MAPSVKKIGVLALQGSVAEHMAALERLPGVRAYEVRRTRELMEADALILPGGESTTIATLLRIFGLFEPLRARIRDGMPVWGTCAGLILLAREIIGEPPHLGLMDITVRRNAFGRQSDSFAETVEIPAFGPSATPLVFIRAPWIESAGPEAEVLCTLHGHIVAARQQNMLVTSFHPELTDNLNVYRYFLRMAD